jgi:hypothetical protein
MKKLLLAVALVVGLCGGAFGAEAPSIRLDAVDYTYYADGVNRWDGRVDISDFETTKTVKGLDPDRDVVFSFNIESYRSRDMTVDITITPGTSEEQYGPVTWVVPETGRAIIHPSYTTRFSPGQSKEIMISAMEKGSFVPSLGITIGGMLTVLTFTAEAKMTADDPGTPAIPVTGVDLKVGPSGTPAARVSAELKANQGDTCQLTAVVYPDNATNKKVTWRTSDSAVASVDDSGKVTGRAAGSAVITARTENGGFEAACDVTVVQDALTKDLLLDFEEITLKTGETKSITASFANKSDSANVQWRVEGSNIATIEPLLDTCRVTGVSLGTTRVVATLGETSAYCTITVAAGTPDSPSGGSSDSDGDGGGGGGCNAGFLGMTLLFAAVALKKR